MKSQVRKIPIHRLAVAFFLICVATSASAIVLHPHGEPDLETWTDRPDSNTVGRWGSNASCVAIAPNYIITTKHQGSANSVVIAGVTYLIDHTWYHSTADFRVLKLHSANLKSYAPMYTKTDEQGQPIVIGGFGKRREPTDTTNPYAWTTEYNNINNPLLYGTNKIDSINTSTYQSEVLVADFDLSDSLYECTIAEFDSGGGWFIKDTDEKWKVAGLTRAVSDLGGFSDYRPLKNYLDAVRVSAYAPWVDSLPLTTCPQPVPGDFDGNCVVDNSDLVEFISYWMDNNCEPVNNYCQGADFEPDGDVDMTDFALFTKFWMQDYPLP